MLTEEAQVNETCLSVQWPGAFVGHPDMFETSSRIPVLTPIRLVPARIQPPQSFFFSFHTIDTRPLPPQLALMGPETRLDKGGRRGSSVGRNAWPASFFFPTLTRSDWGRCSAISDVEYIAPYSPGWSLISWTFLLHINKHTLHQRHNTEYYYFITT